MAAALVAAGKRVVVLEKGPWLHDGDFRKDEIGASRRSMYSPDRRAQPQVVETYDADEGWQAYRLLHTGIEVLEKMGGRDVYRSSRGAPATNLPAGTCRMGRDPQSSVVDADCRVYDVDNLYIADASTWPTGGSVPPTWTVYANALRIAAAMAGRV